MTKHFFFILIFLTSCQYFKENKSAKKSSENPLVQEIDLYSEKILDSPKNANLYFKRGQLYWQNKENEFALNDFYKMISYDSTKPLYYLTLAEFFVDNANVERGISSLDYAIKLDPYSPKYHILQGKYSLILKKYQDAINHLNNALKRDIHNPEAYFYKGYVYKESNQIDKAISNFVTATEQDPTWDIPFEFLGQIYADQKNDLCLTYFDNAVKANPKNTSALNNKAYYLKSKGKLKEATKIYEDLVAQSGQNVEAIYNLGIMNFDQKNYTKALKQFEICTQVDPTNALAFYMIGKTQISLGQKNKAITALQNAYNFDTTLVEAKTALIKLSAN